jgi:phosphoenolpyruvate carboxykinase (ATP)
MSEQFSLAKHGITVENVSRNSIPAALYERGLVREHGTAITSTGALVALSGAKTGRTSASSSTRTASGTSGGARSTSR